MEDRKSFVFYAEWAEVLQGYPADVRLEVYEAAIRYAVSGDIVELRPLAKMAFRFIRHDIDRDRQRFEDVKQKRREAGRRGGAPQGNSNAAQIKPGNQGEHVENQEEQAETTKIKQNKQNKQKQAKQAKSSKTSLYVDVDDNKEKLSLKENFGAAEASLLPEVSGKACESSQAEATEVSVSGNKGEKSERIDYAGFLACWNKIMAGTNVPAMKSFTDKRCRTLKARIDTYGKDTVLAVMRKIPTSDFLAGRVNEFRATFDWTFAPTNFQKILEGNYDNNSTPRASPGESLSAQRKDAEAKARIAAETAERKRRQADTAARAVSRQEFLRQAEQHRKMGDYEQWAASLEADYQARADRNP